MRNRIKRLICNKCGKPATRSGNAGHTTYSFCSKKCEEIFMGTAKLKIFKIVSNLGKILYVNSYDKMDAIQKGIIAFGLNCFQTPILIK